MTAKEIKRSFETAMQRMRDAETAGASIGEQLATARAHLEKTKNTLAGMDEELNSLLGGSSGVDEVLGKAAKVQAKKLQIESEVVVLRRLCSNLERLHEQSAIRIATAQHECQQAQRRYVDARYEEQFTEFFAKHAGALIDLARAAYQRSLWHSLRGGFGYDQTLHAETFAKHNLQIGLVEFFRDEANCGRAQTLSNGELPIEPVWSKALTPQQQTQLSQPDAMATEAGIRRALAVEAPKSEPALDPSEAVRRIREFEGLITQNEIRVEDLRTRLKATPDDPALVDDLREGEAIIARHRRNLATWQGKLVEWRARQAA